MSIRVWQQLTVRLAPLCRPLAVRITEWSVRGCFSGSARADRVCGADSRQGDSAL